jgi:predicted enzyme related to lactoylglutathione lyase
VTSPPLASILLASTDPARLRDWYVAAFDAYVNADGFMQFGGVAVLIDERDDIAPRSIEPGRVILNFHVDDAHATAARLDELAVSWLAPLEFRDDGWFATLADPDGNIVQIIELSVDYLERQRLEMESRDG